MRISQDTKIIIGDDIVRKKEIIAASLVVLIGLAGYLNWSYQDSVRVRDNASYVETGKMLGEAEMVSSNNKAEADDGDKSEAEDAASESTAAPSMDSTKYFEDARHNRETARAAAMEALRSASEDEKADEETRKLAGERLVDCASDIELESSIENLAGAKGFPDTCVYLNDGTATVTVKTDGLTEEQAAQLCDIVTGTAVIPPSKVKIIEVK